MNPVCPLLFLPLLLLYFSEKCVWQRACGQSFQVLKTLQGHCINCLFYARGASSTVREVEVISPQIIWSKGSGNEILFPASVSVLVLSPFWLKPQFWSIGFDGLLLRYISTMGSRWTPSSWIPGNSSERCLYSESHLI